MASPEARPSSELVHRLLTALPLGDYFTPEQLAAQMAKPASWVFDAILQGDLPARRVRGEWVISKDALNAFLRGGGGEAGPHQDRAEVGK